CAVVGVPGAAPPAPAPIRPLADMSFRAWRWFSQFVIPAGLLLSLAGPASGQGSPAKDLIGRGKYILGAAAGCGCHTEPGKAEPGKTLNTGGRKYDGPFGSVYSSNITPDKQTGIG